MQVCTLQQLQYCLLCTEYRTAAVSRLSEYAVRTYTTAEIVVSYLNYTLTYHRLHRRLLRDA